MLQSFKDYLKRHPVIRVLFFIVLLVAIYFIAENLTYYIITFFTN